jgi:pimeloyl-ACP methyl ester carboxylesterase
MPTITSADGTPIAYERAGAGPAVILVDGALCYRASGPMRPLATLLKDHFTVYAYDRRGRGDSGDTLPYAVHREVDDLRALVAEAGGSAYAYAMSSGGALVLAAAAAGVPLTRLALYEPPYLSGIIDGAAENKKAYGTTLREALDAGRPGDAAALFMTFVGTPAEAVAGMRTQPNWAVFEGVAPTLAYDDQLLGDGGVPHDIASRVVAPTLVVSGDAGPLRPVAEATAGAIPGARHVSLPGQTHDVAPDALAPVLVEFFALR